MSTLLYYLKGLIPGFALGTLRPPYHYLLSFLAALRYGFPSRKVTVIGVTGTKGKSTGGEVRNTLF